ncbi:MAG TPA: zinc-dependent metalloprotease [Acidimicrobiia bacterium]|nr:zinc-dependent metalloprotease [Acidimicrobiia bacterium]
MSGIDWSVATRVAGRLAGSHPLEDSYHFGLLERQASGFVTEAARLVEEETGLHWIGDPTVRVLRRADWARGSIDSFGRLLAPAERKLMGKGRGGFGRRLVSRLLGAEVGALVGVLSKRVLGQYELVLPSGDEAEGDVVLFVGANILMMERQHEFRPDEFRFWVALHECTHRLQFTGVPWLRPYFFELVEGLVEMSDPEPGRLQRIAGEMREAAREGRPMVDESGLMGVLATPEQRDLLDRVQSLMALLEGHGHVVMDRIGARRLVTQDRMSRILKLRRKDPRTAAFFRLTGLEMKMKQYELGERFILDVERTAGFSALDTVWVGPDHLPTLDEIKAPRKWLERVG